MKKGLLIKEWLGITLETYLLYNLLWLSIDYRDFHWSYLIDPLDVVYCVSFAFSSIVIMHLSLKKTLRNKISPQRFFLNGLLTFLLNILLAIAFETISNTYVWPAEGEDFWFSTYIMCIVASFVSVVHLLYHYTGIIKQQYEENISLAKSNLKAQLDPHFVFNSMNILAGLVEEDPKRAEQFILSFSRIYRNVIYNLSNDTITISDAMRLAKDYVVIMNERFPSSIELIIEDLHIGNDEKIITMASQLIIENAVKHNRPSPECPLVIKIRRQDNYLEFTNNIITDNSQTIEKQESSGLGLNNLFQRYAIECKEKPVITTIDEDDNKYYSVKIPILKSNESINH